MKFLEGLVVLYVFVTLLFAVIYGTVADMIDGDSTSLFVGSMFGTLIIISISFVIENTDWIKK